MYIYVSILFATRWGEGFLHNKKLKIALISICKLSQYPTLDLLDASLKQSLLGSFQCTLRHTMYCTKCHKLKIFESSDGVRNKHSAVVHSKPQKLSVQGEVLAFNQPPECGLILMKDNVKPV